MNHNPNALAYDLGYMVDNVLEGPNVVVARSHVGENFVNIIIAGRVVCVSLRQLVNALQRVKSDNTVTIVTPENR